MLLSETVMAEPRDTRCEQHAGTDKDQRDYSGPFVQRPTVSRHSLTLMNFDYQYYCPVEISVRQAMPDLDSRGRDTNLGIT